MAKDHHPKSSNAIFSSIRRTFLRNAPASIVEEMRPILLSSKKGDSANSKKGDSANSSSSGHTNNNSSTNNSSSTMGHHGGGVVAGSFEFSVRDHSDASAKRGFRVQIPKRILCYTIVVFFILPLVLFLYVELHRQSLKRQAARYHSYDTHKVLPHLLQDDEHVNLLSDPPVHLDDPTRPIHDVTNATSEVSPYADTLHTDTSGTTIDTIETKEPLPTDSQQQDLVAGAMEDKEAKAEDSQEDSGVVLAASSTTTTESSFQEETELGTSAAVDHGLANEHDASLETTEPLLSPQHFGNSSTSVSSLKDLHMDDSDGSETDADELGEQPSTEVLSPETSNAAALEEVHNVTITTATTTENALDEESIPTGGSRRYLRAQFSRTRASKGRDRGETTTPIPTRNDR